jgi:Carboxymuconolactone decarboxylase family
VMTREQVAEEHRAAYDEITSIRGRPPVMGPSSVIIDSPETALCANGLSEYLGEQSHLPEKIKRLAALIAARFMDCQFNWNAHAAAGRRAGLSDTLVDTLWDKKPLNPELRTAPRPCPSSSMLSITGMVARMDGFTPRRNSLSRLLQRLATFGAVRLTPRSVWGTDTPSNTCV